MNFNNDEPLSATTVVVDVDTMAEELKRLRNKLRGEGRDEERGTRDEETPPESPPTSQGGKATGPVYRPSWGGRFPPVAKPEGVGEERELGAFRCGR